MSRITPKKIIMSTQLTPLAGAYLANGTIGNVGMPGAPVVHFSLVVVPGQHKVTGYVHVTQATQNGNLTGQVTGTIYSTGYGEYSQVISLYGTIYPNLTPYPVPFEAHIAINNDWNGIGGFHYGYVHVEGVPVAASNV
jgi:hypothetical protein